MHFAKYIYFLQWAESFVFFYINFKTIASRKSDRWWTGVIDFVTQFAYFEIKVMNMRTWFNNCNLIYFITFNYNFACRANVSMCKICVCSIRRLVYDQSKWLKTPNNIILTSSSISNLFISSVAVLRLSSSTWKSTYQLKIMKNQYLVRWIFYFWENETIWRANKF